MARKTIKVFDTTQEQIDKILPENKELMEDFVNYLEATDHSPKSIKVYISNLNIFFVYLMEKAHNKDFVNIKKRDILNFQNYMLKSGLGSARIKNIRSSISSLSNYIESMLSDEEEKWENFRNIVSKIPAPNPNTVREKTVLSDEECQKILNKLVKLELYQEACAFALAWSSGRRKSELLRIKRSYIKDEYLQYGSLYKTPEKIKTKGRGVNGKLLNVYILKSKFQKYFDLWMKKREEMGVPDDIDEIFVVKRKGQWCPADIGKLDYIAEKISKLFDIDFYFHCMRHNFCTEMLRNKIPSNVVQNIIGWASAEMCNVYSDLEIDEELGDYFDEGGIKKNIESGSLNNL